LKYNNTKAGTFLSHERDQHSSILVLTLIGVSLALSLASKTTLVSRTESPLLTRVSKIAILLGDSLRSLSKLLRNTISSLIEVRHAVGSALGSRRVLHVLAGEALGLGRDTALGGVAESALLARVGEVGVLLGDGLGVGGHLGDDVLGLLLEVGGAVCCTLGDGVGGTL
jgi:hypothetical protein